MRAFFLSIFVILGLIIVSAFAISVIKERPIKKLSETNILTEPIIYPDDPVLGNSKAPISLVEFGDFECSACQKVEPILKKF